MTGLPDPDDLVVPDLPDAIVAYRQWRIDELGQLFSPMFTGPPWPVGRPLEAHCDTGAISVAGASHLVYLRAGSTYSRMWRQGFGGLPPPARAAGDGAVDPSGTVTVHKVPCPPAQVSAHDGHGCGLYGIRSADECRIRWGALLTPVNAGFQRIAGGEVWLSGEVLEYSDGYRASRATPKALWRDPFHLDHLERASRLYDIPIIDGPKAAAVDIDSAALLKGFTATRVVIPQHLVTSTVRQHLQQLLQAALQGVPASMPTSPRTLPAPPPRRRRRLRRPAGPLHKKTWAKALSPEAHARIERARARRWAGGSAAAASLGLAAWRRGDLLWSTPAELIIVSGSIVHLAAAAIWIRRARRWGRILRGLGG